MPLFFFVSGLLFNPEKWPGFGSFIRSRLYSLIVPYLSFAALAFVVLGALNSWNGRDLFEYWQFLATQVATGGSIVLPEWFLPCLFITELASYILFRSVPKSKWLRIFVAVIVAGSSYALAANQVKTLFWGVSSAAVSMLFFVSAATIRGTVFRAEARSTVLATIIAITMFAVTLAAALALPDRNDLSTAIFLPNLFVTSYSGSLGCMVIARLFPHNRILCYLGPGHFRRHVFCEFRAGGMSAHCESDCWHFAVVDRDFARVRTVTQDDVHHSCLSGSRID